ncbi:MAG: hypothetical protein IT158_06355 [Bryobacterales bacterium]|nr:hypothetical protein [Bryobacterales bacterium]
MNILRLLAVIWVFTTAAWAATFGKVVPIGGHISDLAYDARRDVVYIANFTANRINVLSGSSQSLMSPIYVPQQPSSVALSPDGRFLVVGHYGEWTEGTIRPALTVIDLDANVRRTLAMGNSPLAVAFGRQGPALIVTNRDFQLLDPFSGTLRIVGSWGELTTEPLPTAYPKSPPEVLQASAGVSGDGEVIYVLAQAESAQVIASYRVTQQVIGGVFITSKPDLGPRVVSVNRDGGLFVAGWALSNPAIINLAQFPYPTGKLNVGSHAFDWLRNVIYAQIPVATTTTTIVGGVTTTTTTYDAPTLHIVDTDNLAVRERIQLKENLAGKSVFSADMQVLYAASESGVTILPVGALDRTPRVQAVQEDLLFRGSACDRRAMVRELDIVDPGGGNTDFYFSGGGKGVTVTPSSGVTPTRVQVQVDPSYYLNYKGTVALSLQVGSLSAVNLPMPVRLLINTHEPEQRGTNFSIPGKVVDVLADPVRNRFYAVRQDKNQVLAFDASSYEQIAVLRTGNTPTQMAITRDGRFLMVGNDNSQIANVYDLDSLQPSTPIIFPFGHYPRSLAVSNNAILATVRSAASPEHKIDRVQFEGRTATELPSLGIYKNAINVDTGLAASPTGNTVLAGMPDGNVLLYDAEADTFIAARKDFASLGGALAPISDQLFLADRHVLNWSLVPVASLESGTGSPSGGGFVDGLGLRTTSLSPAGPGVIQRLDPQTFDAVRPTMMIESPLAPKDLKTAPIGQIGQTILPFLRTLAPLSNRTALVSLTTSGFTVLPWDFDAALAQPSISGVVNAADQTEGVAPGGLISVFGSNLSPITAANSEVPVPTTLGEACVTVNGILLPITSASPTRINAQLPFEVVGAGRLVVKSPGGTSQPFDLTVHAGSPAIFRSGTAGPNTGIATVVRSRSGGLVTLSNPIHPEDEITIYLTGLGQTSPVIGAGEPGPWPPAYTSASPQVSLGNAPLEIWFAGVTPGQVGVYQINAKVPYWVPTGLEIPLVITQSGQSTTLSVRVVK